MFPSDLICGNGMMINGGNIIFLNFVPFHKGKGTGGTRETRLVNDFQGIPLIECVQTGFLVLP